MAGMVYIPWIYNAHMFGYHMISLPMENSSLPSPVLRFDTWSFRPIRSWYGAILARWDALKHDCNTCNPHS
jgi:hypothetical protein